jgi:DNA invertase Pin-like site-specific DNA recombinase
MTTAAIYARKSTQQEGVADEAKSVTRQTELARAFAEQKGWTVDDAHVYIDDGVSGAMFDEARPALAALLVAVAHREFSAVVTMDESRIGRDQYRAAYVLQQIHDAECETWYYQDNRRVEMDTATGKFMESVKGFASEMEREKAGARTREALRAKARAGFVAGSKLFGYTNVRPAPKAPVKREIDAEQAAVVKRIFERYAAGDGHLTIRDALNLDKIVGPRGAWASTTVRDVLQNEHYIGRVTWGKLKPVMRKGKSINVAQPPSSWITIEAPELRIIPQDLWDKAQARREQARHATPRARNGRLMGRSSQADQRSEHVLSGFLKCGVCGGPIRIETQVRGPKAKQYHLREYLCATNHQRGAAGCENDTRVKKGIVESAVMAAIGAALSPERVTEALEVFLAERRARMGQRDERRTQIEREMTEIAKREARLVAAVTKGETVEPLIAALKGEQAKRQALETEMLDLTAMPKAPKLWTLHEDAYREAARTRVGDVLALLQGKAGVGPTRTMLRRALEGAVVVCYPAEQNGIKAFRFETRLAVGLIVGDTLPSPTGSSRPVE